MTAALLDALAGDAAIEAFFSESREIEAMLAFETALAGAEADAGIIPAEAATAIAAACREFPPSLDTLRAGMAKDGVVGPSFVAILRKAVAEPHRQWLHFGATSQDLVDTGLVLRLKPIVAELGARLTGLIGALRRLKETEGDVALMAQTRMQRALPYMAGDKIDTWLRPLERDLARLAEITPRLLVLQFGGPVGTRSGLAGKGDLIAEKLAERLGLSAAPAWHTARDSIVEWGGWLSLVSGTLGKIGADIALMAQNEVAAIRIAGGGGSSAMAHKSNPVGAEVLTALARFNAGLIGTLNQALVHENERSGAAWTLEWLVLPTMTITTGAALRHAGQLIAAIRFLPDAAR